MGGVRWTKTLPTWPPQDGPEPGVRHVYLRLDRPAEGHYGRHIRTILNRLDSSVGGVRPSPQGEAAPCQSPSLNFDGASWKYWRASVRRLVVTLSRRRSLAPSGPRQPLPKIVSSTCGSSSHSCGRSFQLDIVLQAGPMPGSRRRCSSSAARLWTSRPANPAWRLRRSVRLHFTARPRVRTRLRMSHLADSSRTVAGATAGPCRSAGRSTTCRLCARRAARAGPGRGRRRALHRRRRLAARLPQPSRADGRALRRRPSRQRPGDAALSHRRPGALARRRRARVPGTRRHRSRSAASASSPARSRRAASPSRRCRCCRRAARSTPRGGASSPTWSRATASRRPRPISAATSAALLPDYMVPAAFVALDAAAADPQRQARPQGPARARRATPRRGSLRGAPLATEQRWRRSGPSSSLTASRHPRQLLRTRRPLAEGTPVVRPHPRSFSEGSAPVKPLPRAHGRRPRCVFSPLLPLRGKPGHRQEPM